MDLTTTYLGLELNNPIVPSASPLSEKIENLKRMEDAGAAAVVMHSLFEEQINEESHLLDHYLSYGSESYAEALHYFPEAHEYKVGPEGYLNLIRQAKESLSIPVIGSLNGVSTGGWIDYATRIQEAGADALELNIYYMSTKIDMTGEDVEKMYVDIVADVKKSVSIPVAVKISPFFSSMANMAQKLVNAGADGLVFFNRFFQPDFDLEQLEVVPHLVLSSKFEHRLPLRWIAILYGRLDVDFAHTRAIASHEEVLKSLMAGAKVTMITSEILRNGIGRVGEILSDLEEWMEEKEYESVRQMQGSMSQIRCPEPAAFERANYMKVLHSWRPDPTGKLL
jgi:dihydroorotate dehydrogenase (fumarate)